MIVSARLRHAITNRLGRVVARVSPPKPEEFLNDTGQFSKIIFLANRWEYGSRFGLPGYEYRRFTPALNMLARHLTFIPIELHDESINAILRSVRGHYNVPILSVFQNLSDIPEAYFRLKETGSKLINWYTDDDMLFAKFSSKVANSFDLNVTTFEPNVPKFHALGAKVLASQWAGVEGIEFLWEKRYLATFIGRMYGARAQLAESLKTHYGERVFTSDTRLRSIPENEMLRIYQESLFAIDEPVSYDGANLQIKARIFENASMGSVVLTKCNARLNQYFKQNEEILFYRDYVHLFQILDDALSKPDRYLKVARAGYDRARTEHTYEKRFREMLNRAIG